MRIQYLTVMAGMACVLLQPASQFAEARPNYNKEFWAKYDKEIGKFKETTKCNVCHFGAEKKNRNDYGKAVGEALVSKDVGGKKQETDLDKIKAALDKAAKEKSGTEGKTFGDLIKDGKLPGKAAD